MNPEELARHLTAERKRLKITQQEVADFIGSHISQVQTFEYKPHINRKIETYLKYAQAIGLTVEFSTQPIEPIEEED